MRKSLASYGQCGPCEFIAKGMFLFRKNNSRDSKLQIVYWNSSKILVGKLCLPLSSISRRPQFIVGASTWFSDLIFVTQFQGMFPGVSFIQGA